MGSRLLTLSVLLVLTAANGCTSVCAHERGTLASARMRLDEDGGEAFLTRGLLRAREEGHVAGGAAAASAGGGGGCGCN